MIAPPTLGSDPVANILGLERVKSIVTCDSRPYKFKMERGIEEGDMYCNKAKTIKTGVPTVKNRFIDFFTVAGSEFSATQNVSNGINILYNSLMSRKLKGTDRKRYP